MHSQAASSSRKNQRSVRLAHLRALYLVGFLLLLAAVLPHIPLSRRASAQVSEPAGKQKAPAFVPGEILVRFRQDAKAVKDVARVSVWVGDGFHQFPVQVEQFSGSEIVDGLRLARVAPVDTERVIDALNARPDVLYAEPNYVRRKEVVPNDPRYMEQWALKNTGQSGGIAGADIKAEQAWELTTGSRSIVVGVVDEGIDNNHADLRDNIWRNPAETPDNQIDDDGNGFVDDINGWDFVHNDNTVFDGTYGPGGYQTGGSGDQTDAHGTHVAGIIGATGNNGVGVAGVNWQVSLMSLKFLGPNGGSSANLLSALSYAKSMRDLWASSGGVGGANIQVLNNSYGGAGFSQAELDAIRALNDSHILFIAAAGNDHQDNDRFSQFPANYNSSNIISVAASTASDALASFSNFGLRTVHLAAPGQNILSVTPNGTYDSFSGTSAAGPHVAGVAGLECARYPGISVQRLKASLLFGGNENFNFSATIAGRRLSAEGALQNAAEIDTTPPATVSDFRISSQSGRTINLQWTAPGDDGASGRSSVYEVRFSDNDLSSNSQFDQARSLVVPHPSPAGNVESATVRIPYRHPAGFIGIRVIDNAGNQSGIAQIPVAVSQDIADPYLVTESPATALSVGGTALNLKGDDRYFENYSLPFFFLYYGQANSSVTISTNGVLYFSIPPKQPFDPQNPLEEAADGESSLARLDAHVMIAGLWDDLRTDRRAADNVYVVTPDADRIIFRWQAVTFDTRLPDLTQRGENPVAFEIELRRDGTIQIRYGDGNINLLPVVGISNSEPDAYASTSHTSEAALINLTQAPTVTFTLRNPPPPPSADVDVTMTANPDPAVSGLNLRYSIVVHNNGPDEAPNVTLTDQLPSGVTFVSCTAGQGTCTGPAVGSSGTVTANIGSLGSYSFSTVPVEIVVNVTAAAATNLVNTATVSSTLRDNNTTNNTTTRITGVVQDIAFSGVRAIAAGAEFTVAVRTDGTVWAWGQNLSGQLGDGTKNSVATPTQVTALSNAIGVAAGNGFALAHLSNGTVWAWGYNGYGQLGDGTTTERLTPVEVTGLTGIIAVGVGDFHSVALKNDGTVWCWGAAFALGTNATVNAKNPMLVSGLTNVRVISVGGGHTFALKEDGTVWSWGSNSLGQLGDGTTTHRLTPVQVINLTGVSKLAVGGLYGGDGHSLAVRNDGTVWAWGSNLNLQIGLPNGDFTPHSTPMQVTGITTAADVGGGQYHSVSLLSNGTVWTWGDNNFAQLGYPANCCSAVPGQVIGLSNVQAIAAGNQHNVVILADGSLRSWGRNTYGQLGDGTTTTRPNPVAVTGLATVSLPGFSPDEGEYSVSQNVTISCATSGSVIRYTANGADPTEADPQITSGSSVSIVAGRITLLKAKAWKDGLIHSPVKAAYYIIFPAVNPIDDARNFIRHHYLDFLSREPDQGGWDYWTSEITACGNDAACVHRRRIDVSAAYFVELEFQRTGYVVYRLYRAAHGRWPNTTTRANITYTQFNSDRAQLVDGAGLEQSTINLANAFVQRPEFLQVYNGLSNAQFVNQLFDTAQLAPYSTERQQQIDAMNNSGKTRAQVLLAVVEIGEFKTREYNPAFVLMQYFGYLRRDPDQGGYDFWLNVLNNRVPNNFRAMVCAFLTSAEYQQRFGSAITRANNDCSQ